MLKRLWLVLLAVAIAGAAGLPPAASQASPNDAVFQIQVIHQVANGYREVESGTGFFITPTGTALTNSHVIYLAQHDPTHYRILALVGSVGDQEHPAEFYEATVTCSSSTKPASGDATLGRDVAEIALAPSTLPFPKWGRRIGDTFFVTAVRHEGPMPQFPTLPIAGRVSQGESITVVGFGHIGPLPEKWTAVGQVDRTSEAGDGTPLFKIAFTQPAQAGNSGSPVLDEHNQVIGMFTWYSKTNTSLGFAQGNDVLKTPCR